MRKFSSTPGRQMGAHRPFKGPQSWGVVLRRDGATVSVTDYFLTQVAAHRLVTGWWESMGL